MRQFILTSAFVLIVSSNSLTAQEVLPLPNPIVVDQEIIVVDDQTGVSSYQQIQEEETVKERITRLAREKREQSRARMKVRKDLGISLSRPVIDAYGPQYDYNSWYYIYPRHSDPYLRWNNQSSYSRWLRNNYNGY